MQYGEVLNKWNHGYKNIMAIVAIKLALSYMNSIFLCRKQTKQIHEQLKETQNRKTYSLNASSVMAKSECMAQSRVQLQNVSNPVSYTT